jgi:DNA-binding winged helix-turn-helix (wHTH) protein
VNDLSLFEGIIVVSSEASNQSSLLVTFNEHSLACQGPILSAFQLAGFEVRIDQNTPHILRIDVDCPLDSNLLDLILPVLNGLKYCRNYSLPKLFIQNDPDEMPGSPGPKNRDPGSKLTTVRLGELISSVQALLMNVPDPDNHARQVYRYEGLVLDPGERQVYKKNRNIPLTPIAFRLLACFMQRVGEVLSKDTLLKQVWGYTEFSGDSNLIDTAIRRLRLEIEDNPRQPYYIQTVRGSGYRFGGQQTAPMKLVAVRNLPQNESRSESR